jgi:MOSC domain-containing protein
MARLRLASIGLYPVKSLRGVPAAEAEVEPWGLRGDRRFIVLEPDGTVLTAREEHRLLGLTASPLAGGGVSLTAPDGATLEVEPPVDAVAVPASVSRLESVRDAGRAAQEWLSGRLARPVRLGWLDDPRRRSVSPAHGGHPGDPLNLSDAGPILLTTSASLRQLNEWIAVDSLERGGEPPAPLAMGRFRPSVVLDGEEEPFAEDGWSRVRIGEVELRFAEHCDRCVLTTIDPETLVGGKEPLRTLARHRRWDSKTWFGVRLIPASTGTIRVGDSVTVG